MLGTLRGIIFDLDDTLMDTWGQLVRPAAQEACAAMISAGLNTDLETCVRERERLFQEFPREDVYALLVERFGCQSDTGTDAKAVRDAGSRAYFQREVPANLRPFHGVPKLLERLQRTHGLYLVTTGNPTTQGRKVEALKLGPFFRQVVLLDSGRGETKVSAFSRILAREGWMPSQVLAVGDRVDREVRAGRHLGISTCRVHYGEFRHLQPMGPEETPDFVIQHILELERHLLGESQS